MPTRDRNHELETESQRAFASALPSNLVVRGVEDDYGIDREVEVFVDGKTTGLTFKVQLKGTDKSGKTRRIKRSHLEYWMQLDVPVLLVSFEAPTKTLRGVWVHAIGADGPDTGAETLTVHMDPEVDITGAWPASLADDLTLLRALKRGDIPVPTPVRVVIDDDVPDVAVSHVMAALLNASRRTSHPMRQTRDESEAALTFRVSQRRFQAALPLRFGSCNLHFPDGFILDMDPLALGEVGLIFAAGAVSPINDGVARTWLKGADPSAPTWGISEFAERFMPVLAAPDCVELLLEVNAHLVEQDNREADMYAVAVLDYAEHAESSTFESYSTRIRNRIKVDAEDGGRLAFNLASLHRRRREHASAVELFKVAAAKRPAYLTDPIYQRSLGGSQWDLQQYNETAEAYETALANGFDPHELLPLLADTLMYAGRYAEARDVIDRWEPQGRESDRLGLLRRDMLTALVDGLGLTTQDRANFDTAAQQLKLEALRDADEPSADMLRELLRTGDALHPIPWMYLSMAQDENRDHVPAVMFAVAMFDLAHAWVVALVHALAYGANDSVVRAIVDQARFHCKQEFFDAVWEAADEQDDEEATILRDLVSAAYSSEPDALISHIRFLDSTHSNFIVDIERPSVPDSSIPGST